MEGRASVRRIWRARRHAAACPACSRLLAMDRRVRPSLDALRKQQVPPELRRRVLAALAWEATAEPLHRRARRVRVLGPGIAAVVAVGAFLAISFRLPPASVEPAGDIFVEDFLRRAVMEEQIVTSDPVEVARFLTRELGRPAAPLVVGGLQIIKAEICLVDNRRGAMVLYDFHGTEVSHYLLPRAGGPTGPPAAAAAVRVSTTDAAGLPAVVLWATAALEQAVVATVPAADLASLVRSAIMTNTPEDARRTYR